jgi:hypothetical protein
MSEVLFVTPNEITGTTIMGGNVDVDKYVVNIAFVQVTVIEPLLGSVLYDKIKADFQSNSLSGDYLTMFDEFIKPITKHSAVAEYIEVSNFRLTNSGAIKDVSENTELPSRDEIKMLSGKYKSMAQTYIQRFDKWICNNLVPEYQRVQDEVNAQKVSQRSGFYFPDYTRDKLKRVQECPNPNFNGC